jgi:hypothetical protein
MIPNFSRFIQDDITGNGMLAVIVIQILLIMLYLIAFTATQMYIEEVIILMLSAIVVIQGELLIKPD